MVTALASACQMKERSIPAYLFELDHHWRFALEWLRVEDNSYKRHDLSGGSPYATQTQLQLSVRYALGSQR